MVLGATDKRRQEGSDADSLWLEAAEQSEAAPLLSIPFRTSSTVSEPGFTEGYGSSAECPRKGSVLLEAWDRRRLLVNTNCKTWGCLSCRDRAMAAFKSKVSTGVSTLGRCSFTTLTYQVGGFRLRGAQCVRKDWAALYRRLRKRQPEVAAMKWLRVMELTRKGVPHYHLVMGPIPEWMPIRCWRRDEKVVAATYLARAETCGCLSHRISKEWYTTTGDSWMVHTTPVTSGKGAGGYLAKYMRKEFDGERGEELGMSRRWSTSQGWPGAGRLRLRQTLKEGWRRHSFKYGHVESDIEGGPADLAELSGSPQALERSKRGSAQRLIRQIQEATDA